MRLIHTAHWQLGKRFGRFEPEVRAVLAEARFDAIDAIGKAAELCHCTCYCGVIHPRFIAKTRPGPCAAAKRRPAMNVK